MSTIGRSSRSQLVEQLRQEKETFDQAKSQDERSFRVRLAFAWAAVLILPTALVTAIVILIFHRDFSDLVVETAAVSLLVDTLSTGASLYRIMITGLPRKELKPVTTTTRPEASPKRPYPTGHSNGSPPAEASQGG